jgi:hypothetical protein
LKRILGSKQTEARGVISPATTSPAGR